MKRGREGGEVGGERGVVGKVRREGEREKSIILPCRGDSRYEAKDGFLHVIGVLH